MKKILFLGKISKYYYILLIILGGLFLLGIITTLFIGYIKGNNTNILHITEQYICDTNSIFPCRKANYGVKIISGYYTITDGDVIITKKHHSRAFILRQLIGQGFTGFINIPYLGNGNDAIISTGIGNYIINTPITKQDILDKYISTMIIKNFFSSGNDVITLSKGERQNWTGIYLFKTTRDLKSMGYQVISHRSRKNKDKDYRRYNIYQSFKLIHNVRVILPGETFNFLDLAQYDEYQQEHYKKGYVISEGKEIKEYGGGICGASTAIYQGILTNKAFKPIQLHAHTKRFGNLYSTTINGKYITTPGIDSAIYAGLIDLRFRNISKHPIILVMNYNGIYNGIEQVFTLGYPYEKGSFIFLHGGYIWHDEPIEEGTGTKSIRGGCYTRKINGEERKSCYQEVH